MKQLRILMWFLVRPRYWRYFVYFMTWRLRNLRHSRNTAAERAQAEAWCAQHAVDRAAVFQQIIGTSDFPSFDDQFKDLLAAGQAAISQTTIPMGGAGDMELLYRLAEHLQVKSVIETGVAFGWSSLALLLSLHNRAAAKLVSTDLAYPRGNSEKYVGAVVPAHFRPQWTIIPYPDRQALPRALKQLPRIDLCHYDSDKSYEGRLWAYPRLWAALRSNGVFVSDDVGDNLAFRDFCTEIGKQPLIYQHKNKYIGLVVKP
jgi:predicted O-methyltransferase YrrM